MKPITILVACGSGIATSTIAQEAVKVLVKKAGIEAKIVKSNLSEIPGKQDSVDVILTTSNYRKPLEKPCMSVFGLISGVNKEATEKKITDLLLEVASE
ncbi:PTS sugar transporter subunit IIB [Tannockella kyphosi]|uniref:PTS sugar transporter subunit IIB n=1 Tax=Tannockella kyphosi TaxID=2899121 RepID=UPI0020137027|nr:PTS sugar transporter subunit IIB [Tannockella kyphosi]